MGFLVCSVLEFVLDRAVMPTPKVVFAVAILFLDQIHTVKVFIRSVFHANDGSTGRVRVHGHRPFPKHRELLKRRRCNDLRCFVRMDEAAPVSKVTPRVTSAQHRLPSGPTRIKRHHLLGGPHTFAHFRMGEGAATGGEEPAVLTVLASTGLEVGHFWVGGLGGLV